MKKSLAVFLVSLVVAAEVRAVDAPANVAAVVASATRVDVSWSPVAGADSYEIDRSSSFGVWTLIGTSYTAAFSDTTVAAGAAYLYRVRAVDGGIASANSAAGLASTFSFTDDPVVPGLTSAAATHVVEIRAVESALRSLAGQSPPSWGETIQAGGVVKGSHLLELRATLDSSRALLGLPALTYAHSLTAGVTPIRATDVMELRAGTTGRAAAVWNSVAGLSGVRAIAGSGAKILAGTAAQGVHRSLDHGANWSLANSGLTTLAIGAVAITSDGTFYAGTTSGGALFRSTDSGASWSLSGASPPANVTTLLPTTKGLFAASSVVPCSGISFSPDGGTTWIPRNSGLLDTCVTSMAVAPDGDLFAATAGGGVFRSTDNGANWSAVNSGITDTQLHAVAVDAQSRVHAASHNGGVFVSSNDGGSWSSTLSRDVYSLFLDPADELFAGGEGNGASVHRSSEGGVWQNAHDRLPRAARIDAFGATSRYRFVVVDGSVYRAPVDFRLHGLDFGPWFNSGEAPGSSISETELRKRMILVRPYTKWIRTFDMVGGMEKAGLVAHSLGLKAALGAYVDTTTPANLASTELQIDRLKAAGVAGEAEILIVGSEVLHFGKATKQQLLDYISEVRQAVPSNILVGTAEIYGDLLANLDVLQAGNVVLPNIYPFWESKANERAIEHLHGKYLDVLAVAGTRPVIISESGWPDVDESPGDTGAAVASPGNASAYFLDFVSWSRANRVPAFYFATFDEPWKAEGGVGAHWGMWKSDRTLKQGMDAVLAGDMADRWSGTILVGGPGTPSIGFTHVPAYGNLTEFLRGTVTHVRPAEHRVAVYIYVGGWWNKPTHAEPLTKIYSDGTWECDIVTGGNDQLATQIAAFVVPSSYVPQLLSGAQQLPNDLYQYPNLTVTRP